MLRFLVVFGALLPGSDCSNGLFSSSVSGGTDQSFLQESVSMQLMSKIEQLAEVVEASSKHLEQTMDKRSKHLEQTMNKRLDILEQTMADLAKSGTAEPRNVNPPGPNNR